MEHYQMVKQVDLESKKEMRKKLRYKKYEDKIFPNMTKISIHRSTHFNEPQEKHMKTISRLIEVKLLKTKD